MGAQEFSALAEKGHRIQPLASATGEELSQADAVVGPRCWRMLEGTVKYLPALVKGVRVEVYGPTGKKRA